LLGHGGVVVAATSFQSPKSQLQINGGHRLTVLPNWANQLDNRRSSLNLSSSTRNHQLKPAQNNRSPCEGLESVQRHFSFPRNGKGSFSIRKVEDETTAVALIGS
jgi:predicted ATPase